MANARGVFKDARPFWNTVNNTFFPLIVYFLYLLIFFLPRFSSFIYVFPSRSSYLLRHIGCLAQVSCHCLLKYKPPWGFRCLQIAISFFSFLLLLLLLALVALIALLEHSHKAHHSPLFAARFHQATSPSLSLHNENARQR